MAIKFLNIAAAQKEMLDCLKSREKGPKDPSDLDDLKKKINAAGGKLPLIYERAAYKPYAEIINGLTKTDFKKLSNPRSAISYPFIDLAQAIIQASTGFEKDATEAFEEVVSDLYDGFLSAEDRHNIKLPDHSLLPPLVKWGNPDDGPYTDVPEATATFNVKCAVVNLPPSNAHGGLVGWGCLGHETAGHDIVHADEGLLEEMAGELYDVINADKQITNGKTRKLLAKYWSDRVDEAASDVMGILNMGPAAAASMIPFFRSLLKNADCGSKLRSEGPADDEHPADILRAMLGASAVRLLSFSDNKAWADAILAEGMKDLETIILNDSTEVDKASAQRSAAIVAQVLMQKEFAALKNHALQEIQDWGDKDEAVVAGIRKALKGNITPHEDIMNGAYAAHVVAAAIYEGLLVKQGVKTIFSNMIKLLKKMHEDNPSWGPLFVAHPGNLKRSYLINIPCRS